MVLGFPEAIESAYLYIVVQPHDCVSRLLLLTYLTE